MSELLDEKQIATLKVIFKKFDLDNDGKLSINELGTLFQCLNENYSTLRIQELMNEVDITKSGLIDFPQLLFILEGKLDSVTVEEEYKEAFDCFNINNDGFVTVEELRITLTKLQEQFTEEDLNIMMQQVDIDGDGLIAYEEFYHVMTTK